MSCPPDRLRQVADSSNLYLSGWPARPVPVGLVCVPDARRSAVPRRSGAETGSQFLPSLRSRNLSFCYQVIAPLLQTCWELQNSLFKHRVIDGEQKL